MPPKFDRQREEEQRRRLKARLNFKSLIRKVILNNYWLSELENQVIGENVKRNVQIITRRRETKWSLLSIVDKTILNIPAHERTNEQKRHLVPLFLDLPCLSRFSPVSFLQLCSDFVPYTA